MEENKMVSFWETVELFLTDTIPFIQSNIEIPRFNIIFSEDFFKLLEESSLKLKVNQSHIDNLKQMSYFDNDNPTIIVHDPIFFFQSLTDITNRLFELHQQYGSEETECSFHLWILRRIWLRMGLDDCHQVERFLQNQLSFVRNNQLDSYQKESIIGNYCGYKVRMKAELNCTYDETTRRMQFRIYDDQNSYYSLPNIYYDILNEENQSTCYIYAIQNDRDKNRIPKIERLLYKLNKGINNLETEEYKDYKMGRSDYYPENISDIHPSQVLSLMYFIKLLKKHNINKIKVPVLQVLSYDYHILLSEKMKEDFELTWTIEVMEDMRTATGSRREWLEDLYSYDKKWYDHIVDKEDLISKNKVETFIRIFRRVNFYIPEMEICNEPMLQGDCLDIKLEKSKIKSKIK